MSVRSSLLKGDIMQSLFSFVQASPSLKGQTILITGASSGIGEQIAKQVAAKEATVILTGRHYGRLSAVKEACEQACGHKAYMYQLDLADIDQVDKVLSTILEQHRVDVLMNNAGYGMTELFVENKYQDIEKLFQVNVLSLMYVTQRVAIQMLDHGGGHLFHTASMAGKVATPKTAVYSATKAAVIAFSNALRVELAPYNIHVTTINPGPVDTRFFERIGSGKQYLERVERFMLSSEEVASKVVASIGHAKREITVPWSLKLGNALYHVMPSVGDKILQTLFSK